MEPAAGAAERGAGSRAVLLFPQGPVNPLFRFPRLAGHVGWEMPALRWVHKPSKFVSHTWLGEPAFC